MKNKMFLFVMLAVVALLTLSCSAAGAATFDKAATTTGAAIVGGIAMLQQLLDAGVISTEQFTKLMELAQASQSVVDAVKIAVGALAENQAAHAAQIAAIKADSISTTEAVTGGGVIAAVASGATNYMRNRARLARGEPLGTHPSSPGPSSSAPSSPLAG